jgi:hypothetical protein
MLGQRNGMTTHEYIFGATVLVAGIVYVVAGIRSGAFQSPSVWTEQMLKQKRLREAIGGITILSLGVVCLAFCRDDFDLFVLGIASMPISLFAFMAAFRITRILKSNPSHPEKPQQKH